MVALLVRLSWRQIITACKKSSWSMVAFALQIITLLCCLGAIGAAMLAMSRASSPVLQHIVVAVGSLIVVYSSIARAVLPGEDLLAPERFALLPVNGRQLAWGTIVASLTQPGGIAFIMWTLITLIVWAPVSKAALIIAVIYLPITWLLTTLIVHTICAGLARALARKNLREFILITLVVGFYFGFFAFSSQFSTAETGVAFNVQTIASGLERVSTFLALTPLSAPYGVSLFIASGNWVNALIAAAVSFVSLAVFFWAYTRLISERLTNPVIMRGSGRVASGGLLQRLLPANAVGAVALRVILARRRDPRHSIVFLMSIVLPILLVFMYGTNGIDGALLLFVPAALTLVLGQIFAQDVAYDHRAFAFHIINGVSGCVDRAGRILGFTILLFPVYSLITVFTAIYFGQSALLPQALALLTVSFFTSVATGLTVGVFLPSRAPKPGGNPLSKGSGGQLQTIATLFIVLIVVLVLTTPTILLLLMSSRLPWMIWPAWFAAVLTSFLCSWFAVRYGGKWLERRSPEVFAEISA